MTLNKAWHDKHAMPKNPSEKERIAWHIEHATACGCRPIPPRLKKIIEDRTP